MSKKEENEVIETNEEVLDENEELEATDKEKLEDLRRKLKRIIHLSQQ